MKDIQGLEAAKTTVAKIWAMSAGVIGTIFLAGATFAAVHEPPMVWLCVLLAVPGFAGWIAPYFLYRHMAAKKKQELQPLIDRKYKEIDQICEMGNSLL